MQQVLADSPEARLHDLRQQHDQWARAGYDGHNRRPIRMTMRLLARRRRRRRTHRWLLALARAWSFSPVSISREVD